MLLLLLLYVVIVICDMLLLLLLKNNPCFALGFVRFIPATISLQALDSAFFLVHIQRMKVGYDICDTDENTMYPLVI